VFDAALRTPATAVSELPAPKLRENDPEPRLFRGGSEGISPKKQNWSVFQARNFSYEAGSPGKDSDQTVTAEGNPAPSNIITVSRL
jgi:hypothetical protein